MTKSGTHDSVASYFVQTAMSSSKKSGLTILGVYYFYLRCEELSDLDSQFQPFVDSTLLGDSEKLTSDEEQDESTPGVEKNKKGNDGDDDGSSISSTTSSHDSLAWLSGGSAKKRQ